MTFSPRGYDFVLTQHAEDQIDALSRFNQLEVGFALRDLLVDPTANRPTVTERTGRLAGEPQFVLRLRDVRIYFDMFNPHVSMVRAVRIEP